MWLSRSHQDLNIQIHIREPLQNSQFSALYPIILHQDYHSPIDVDHTGTKRYWYPWHIHHCHLDNPISEISDEISTELCHTLDCLTPMDCVTVGTKRYWYPWHICHCAQHGNGNGNGNRQDWNGGGGVISTDGSVPARFESDLELDPSWFLRVDMIPKSFEEASLYSRCFPMRYLELVRDYGPCFYLPFAN
jgi:hypothetical protein